MRILSVVPFVATVAFGVFANGYCFAQESSSCSVEIFTPKQGDKVGVSGQIKGKASVPPGMYLWLFVHREGLAVWWPQGGGETKIKKGGEWGVHATYGDEANASKDTGANFEIKLVVADKKTNDEIVNYIRTSERENRYPGLPMPPPSEGGCVSK